jgi:hypothetical protein
MPTQVAVPGVPFALPVASGPCVSLSNTNYQFTCISSQSSIPTVFDTFNGMVSAQVSQMGNGTPTIQQGTSCSAGFDSGSNQFVIKTSFNTDTIPFANASISEIAFSSSFLASLSSSQLTVNSLDGLVVSDTTNPDHMQILLYMDSTAGKFTAASGGTISLSGGMLANLTLYECLSASLP